MSNQTTTGPEIRVLFHRLDTNLTRWMARNGVMLLRMSLGWSFLVWALKFFPDLSPAHELAIRTIEALILATLHSSVFMPVWQRGSV